MDELSFLVWTKEWIRTSARGKSTGGQPDALLALALAKMGFFIARKFLLITHNCDYLVLIIMAGYHSTSASNCYNMQKDHAAKIRY